MTSIEPTLGLLVLLASCCTSASKRAEPEATFEQRVVSLKIGMAVEQVVDILGSPSSTESAADGDQVWLWQQRSMRWNVHDSRRSGSTSLEAKVTFRDGAVALVALEYQLVH